MSKIDNELKHEEHKGASGLFLRKSGRMYEVWKAGSTVQWYKLYRYKKGPKIALASSFVRESLVQNTIW